MEQAKFNHKPPEDNFGTQYHYRHPKNDQERETQRKLYMELKAIKNLTPSEKTLKGH